MWKLKNTPLNDQWVKKEALRKIRIFRDMKNKNTTDYNLWGVAKTMLRRKFIVINIHIYICICNHTYT
jgi:hypothetical protein